MTADQVADHTEARASDAPLVGPPDGLVREVDVDGCLTLYRPTADRVLVLNETASDVWRLADGTLDEDALVSVLAHAYDVQPSSIAEGVRATIERFVHEGVLDLTLR